MYVDAYSHSYTTCIKCNDEVFAFTKLLTQGNPKFQRGAALKWCAPLALVDSDPGIYDNCLIIGLQCFWIHIRVIPMHRPMIDLCWNMTLVSTEATYVYLYIHKYIYKGFVVPMQGCNSCVSKNSILVGCTHSTHARTHAHTTHTHTHTQKHTHVLTPIHTPTPTYTQKHTLTHTYTPSYTIRGIRMRCVTWFLCKSMFQISMQS